jgi:5'-nucleotidase
MRILLTNDDGIMAPGIQALYHQLRKTSEVTVIAPEAERSAVGHAITLFDPLRVQEIEGPEGFTGMALNGTPADCVKIAVRAILEEKPDLVISGINPGANVGTNVLYSGTVSAATEGALMGIPSLAVSVKGAVMDFTPAAVIASRLAETIYRTGLPENVSLNVNVPGLPIEEIKGILVTRLGSLKVTEWFDRRIDPYDRVYYWQAGESVIGEGGDDLEVDDAALTAGYVSVTPLHLDLTSHEFMDGLSGWDLGKLLSG